MLTKHWWQSKTFITNLVLIIAMVVQGITGQEWLPAEVQVTIVAFINLVLRLATNQPVGR